MRNLVQTAVTGGKMLMSKARPARIAIIDDAADNAEMLQLILESRGFSAQCFANGVEFTRQFQSGSFDLILLDIAMPDMDGFRTFDQVRRIDPQVPVVAVTANVYEHDRKR